MDQPLSLPNIRNITVSGRIGSGATTLAKSLEKKMGWKLLEGGELFEKIHKELHLDQSSVEARPDHFDLEYEEKIKNMLKNEEKNIIQSHLAGYDAQGIDGVFKILVVTEDDEGNDMQDIRIDRLMNRDGKTVAEAKEEVKEREASHLEKFRRLYANNDPEWKYWDRKYYNLVINTFNHNQGEALNSALSALDLK